MRNLVVPLGRLTLVTGVNGSGKTSLIARFGFSPKLHKAGFVSMFAAENGLASTFWAGPETISRSIHAGLHPVQGTVRFAFFSSSPPFARRVRPS